VVLRSGQHDSGRLTNPLAELSRSFLAAGDPGHPQCEGCWIDYVYLHAGFFAELIDNQLGRHGGVVARPHAPLDYRYPNPSAVVFHPPS